MNPVSLPAAWAPVRASATAPGAARGAEAEASAQGQVWTLQRRCALSPGQFALGLALPIVVCLCVAAGFWWSGAAWVSVFAGVECLVVACAFALHAVHACDGERLSLRDGRLHVERRRGWRVEERVFDLARAQLFKGVAGIELRDRAGAWTVGQQAPAHRCEQVWAELSHARASMQRGPGADESCWS